MFSTVVHDDEEDRERERETAPQRRGLVKRGERSHFYSRRFFFCYEERFLLLSRRLWRGKKREGAKKIKRFG